MNSAYNNKKKMTTTTKPFCKVCYDAGKNESVYTSHFVKDKQGSDGKVVCPYLLSLTCSFCKKSEGHTARHCPVLQKKIGTQQQEQKQDKKENDHDDGWSKVVLGTTSKSAKNAAPVANRINVVLKSSKKTTSSSTTGSAKYINTLATLMEQEEERVINDEFERVDKEVKRVKFDTDFPVLPHALAAAPLAALAPAPAALALALATKPAAKEESCYGTYSITPISICWGDDADDY
jgi:hypothetical protein